MTRKISNWVTRGAQELRELGPYAPYALAAILPGGSIIAAVVWLYRHSRGRSTSLRNLSRTLSIVVALVSLMLLPGCVSSAGLTPLARTRGADQLAASQTLSGEPVACARWTPGVRTRRPAMLVAQYPSFRSTTESIFPPEA